MAAIRCLKTTAAVKIPRLITLAPPLMRFLHLTLSRSYGAAAAQPQFDHDYNYNYYRNQNECEPRCDRSSAPMTNSEGSIPRRGVQWAFIGNPGVKKHVFAEKLSKLLEVPHISTASLVRQELSPRSSLYKQIANAVNHAEHVPEEIIFELLSKRLEDGYYRGETGFILDGIPRSQIQAEIIDQLADIDLVVNFKCIFSRCSSESYRMNNFGSSSLEHARPKFTGNVKCVWDEKLQVYVEQSKAVEEYYRKQKKLLDFEVSSAPGETWQGLLTALHLQDVAAAHYSQKLTPY